MTHRLDNAILDMCGLHADRPAVHDGNVSWTYSDFGDQIRTWSNWFSQPGMPLRIGFVLPNSAAYLAAMYGAVGAGKTPFLIDPGLAAPEIDLLADEVGLDAVLLKGSDPTGADCLGTFGGLRLLARESSGTAPSLHPDTAICRFTTGSSGSPKCLEFSHHAILAAAQVWSRSNRMVAGDVVICLAGFFNGLAFNTSLAATFLSGGLLAIYSGWTSPPQVLRYAATQGATRLVAFPVFYQLLIQSNLSADQIPSSLAWLYSAASKLAEETRDGVKELYGLSIINYYGIAEAGPVTTEPDPGTSRGNAMALEGCALRVIDGLLEVRTPSMATRYLNRPGELESRLTADGFLRTGDLARIEDGRLFLEGRSEPLLDVGGKKFSAQEVEEALLRLPDIEEAFVFGQPAPDIGTVVCAAIVSHAADGADDVRHQLGALLAQYKIPRKIQRFAALPRNGAGKIDAVALRTSFLEGVQ